jgi:two-component system sensor histidine kinase KdpD
VARTVRPGSSPWLAGVVGCGLIGVVVAGMVPLRSRAPSTATSALLLVLPVVVAAVIGGRMASLAVALLAAASFNLAFIRPYWTFKIDAVEDGIAVLVFGVVAVALGTLVAVEADRHRSAEQRTRELQALNEELARLDAERAHLAEEANRVRVLEQVDEQRGALLRSVSHDLRTPLATIRAVVTDLRDGGVHYDDATRAELLDSVASESERLDRLVANLLSMSRIEAGALIPDRQAADLDELIGDRVRRLGSLFDQVRIQVDVPTDLPLVDGDYSQLDQVVTNLLENAARHAPAGSTVRIGARLVGGMVQLEVADEGIGVPDYLRARVFEPFRRGEGSQSSGIGLAICRAVVEAHDGTIAVLDTPGGGATFVVRLPVRHG